MEKETRSQDDGSSSRSSSQLSVSVQLSPSEATSFIAAVTMQDSMIDIPDGILNSFDHVVERMADACLIALTKRRNELLKVKK